MNMFCPHTITVWSIQECGFQMRSQAVHLSQSSDSNGESLSHEQYQSKYVYGLSEAALQAVLQEAQRS